MNKKVGFLLALAVILSAVPVNQAVAWENPLKSYNLYDDVTGGNSSNNSSRERVMDSYNSNSLRPSQNVNSTYTSVSAPTTDSSSSAVPSSLPLYDIQSYAPEPTEPRRNEILRESSRNVYSDPSTPAAWEKGPSFYPNPSFNSIVAKYRKSDFAGCMQECTSYVRQHPRDTLGFYYLAMCYTKVNDKENAIKAYEKVISLNANPMIVKYATNGRNCIMGNDSEKCYQNVNEPEYIYPYKDIAKSVDLTPVDPNILINRNLAQVKSKLAQQEEAKSDDSDPNNPDNNEEKKDISLPFGKQDSDLDKFINAPYGNGLSPDLNKEYQQLQLKRLQETINKEGDESQDTKNYRNIDDIKKFDKHKTDSEQIKLAYDIPENVLKDLEKDPEYIQQKKELEELNMLLGNDKSSKSSDVSDLIPYMNESNSKNISPEVMQTLMMQSMMGGLEI
jgi:tetratricopeptide (TPR) repeat protein